MRCTVFEYSGRFAHFLLAEANASAPTYPVPPRTALLGLTGAVLGLEKDAPPDALSEAMFAVGGGAGTTHWHFTNFRNDVHPPLPWIVKRSAKEGTKAPDSVKQVRQEWLISPRYKVWAVLPGTHAEEFDGRLRERRWHFTPCLGLSEMLADLRLLDSVEAKPLPEGDYEVVGVMRRPQVSIRLEEACARGVGLQSLRMPRDVTPTRKFSHEAYFREFHSKPVPVHTEHAWQVGNDTVMWL